MFRSVAVDVVRRGVGERFGRNVDAGAADRRAGETEQSADDHIAGRLTDAADRPADHARLAVERPGAGDAGREQSAAGEYQDADLPLAAGDRDAPDLHVGRTHLDGPLLDVERPGVGAGRGHERNRCDSKKHSDSLEH